MYDPKYGHWQDPLIFLGVVGLFVLLVKLSGH